MPSAAAAASAWCTSIILSVQGMAADLALPSLLRTTGVAHISIISAGKEPVLDAAEAAVAGQLRPWHVLSLASAVQATTISTENTGRCTMANLLTLSSSKRNPTLPITPKAGQVGRSITLQLYSMLQCL